ncbi:MAG: hypothetical protein HZA54_19650 [Planctomycetes bacterium]|nr:hypothetical protein [Planctomycetota bacterium]
MRRHPGGPPPPDYYLDYGEKYALRFTHELRPLLSDTGRAWLDRARLNLQTAIENERRRDPEAFARLEEDPDAFRRFAYDTHADAYWRAGLADLPIMDLIRIGTTPDLRDLFTEAGLGQVVDIAGRMAQEYYDRVRAAGSDALDDPLGTAGAVWDSFQEGVRDNAQGWWRGVRTLGELF